MGTKNMIAREKIQQMEIVTDPDSSYAFGRGK